MTATPATAETVEAVASNATEVASSATSFFSDPATWSLIASYAVKVIGALLALWIAGMIARWVGRLVTKGLERGKFDATLTKFFATLARYLILVMAILAILGVFGIETTSFAAVIGAAGLAVGLAFQGTLANFSSGVMLLVFRPFKVGDVVSTAGVIGGVQAIDLFTTTFDTPDNRRIIVPNGAIFGSTIENMTHHETRRVNVDVGCDYSADIDETRRVLEAAAQNIPGALEEPAPSVFLSGLGGSSVDWQMRIWAHPSKYWDVYQATIRETKKALDAAKIGIPFPQMDVHVNGKLG